MAYTPMIEQYLEIKKQNKDCILFFRLGDFYEMFFDDAILASRELEIVLTQRDCGNNEKCPMCGVPYHVSELYINKLVSKGYKVAICEQLEDPKLAKGLVKRDIIKIYTPATIIDNANNENGDNNYLMCLSRKDKEIVLSYIDISTGILMYTNFKTDDYYKIIENEISDISPVEILFVEDEFEEDKLKVIANKFNIVLSQIENFDGDREDYLKSKIDFTSKNNLESQNLSNIMHYIYRYEDNELKHINKVLKYFINEYMEIDANSIVNLEIQKNLYTNSKKGSLFGVLDYTKTAMGSRLLHKYLERPLMDKEKIVKRQNYVEAIYSDYELLVNLETLLDGVYDLDRILAKLSYNNANAKDLVALKYSIEKIPQIKLLISKSENKLSDLNSNLDDLKDIYDLINQAIVDDPPTAITEGNIIKENFSKDLDNLRYNKVSGKKELVEYEQAEKERLGIKNLKIVFNKKLGYFIDVTKSNLDKVGDDYEKKQTLTNSSRYKTSKLIQIESKIFDSEDEIYDLEYQIFEDIRKNILDNIDRIQKTSEILAKLDVFTSLAKCAYNNNYVKPQINNIGILEVKNSRHPIVELSVGRENYVKNDISIGTGKDNIQIITGPNMSGKSTYLRQTALINILAQIGSFVPADFANIAIVDKIFTRIGSSDNLFRGESTFMVEMKEMSNILRYATKDSLLVLDEIGRGTSTYDGLSLAWAIVEYISKNIKAKTLFATHYHELIDLEDKLDNVVNLKIEIEEDRGQLLFLRKISRGYTDKSYGIEVAELAGLPKSLVNRAKNILKSIDVDSNKKEILPIEYFVAEESLDHNVNEDLYNYLDYVKSIDINSITPIEAMTSLDEIISEIKRLSE
ncbi:MAG: DNA mismatch repair protein MutS [Finegoldia sp.]|nr:DNA mismatch repair protein MutS [Finegoldia sp.]